MINSRLRVDVKTSVPTKTSLIKVGSPDGSTWSTYHLIWKRCAQRDDEPRGLGGLGAGLRASGAVGTGQGS
ncbi:hypothetical protein D0T12_03740 [Actinomadura spongiicola]|uniref:Uncharacterized protein n=1 Tax=Actinomadura spongiicola TaxID=2303421 RepID=A0A372GPQ7_9ACTN|nr:hypothetical protein D0T12_03740 [Actinomadura spongiicola]